MRHSHACRAARGETLDRCPAPHAQHFVEVRLVGVDDQPAIAGHGAQQQVELFLDRGHVRIDVGVVVLEVVEDRRARPVVHELRALVEERGVVLVGLDHEMTAAAEARADVEIERHAADQEAGIESRVLENPREHAAGRRLAVRAGDAEHPAVIDLQHVARQPVGPRLVALAAVEQRFDQRIATAHHVADHEHVRVQLELVGLVAFDDVDAERRELRAHRRVDVAIGAGDTVAGGARDGRDAAHERAADAEDVQVQSQPPPPLARCEQQVDQQEIRERQRDAGEQVRVRRELEDAAGDQREDHDHAERDHAGRGGSRRHAPPASTAIAPAGTCTIRARRRCRAPRWPSAGSAPSCRTVAAAGTPLP